MYLDTAAPLVKVALEGGFATCLMYGQTGSGKTYTMTSIYERAAFELFDSLICNKFKEPLSVSYLKTLKSLSQELREELILKGNISIDFINKGQYLSVVI